MKRGEEDWEWCSTPYCSGVIISRCFLCGGLSGSCPCGSGGYNTCLCEAEATCFADIKFKNFFILARRLLLELGYGLYYWDWWWFLNGWRGK